MESANNISDWDQKVFQSHNLHYGLYSPSRQLMVLTFAKGHQYQYVCGPDVWRSLTHDPRPGQFFHAVIKKYFYGKPVPAGSYFPLRQVKTTHRM